MATARIDPALLRRPIAIRLREDEREALAIHARRTGKTLGQCVRDLVELGLLVGDLQGLRGRLEQTTLALDTFGPQVRVHLPEALVGAATTLYWYLSAVALRMDAALPRAAGEIGRERERELGTLARLFPAEFARTVFASEYLAQQLLQKADVQAVYAAQQAARQWLAQQYGQALK